jgi:hypothetical protein
MTATLRRYMQRQGEASSLLTTLRPKDRWRNATHCSTLETQVRRTANESRRRRAAGSGTPRVSRVVHAGLVVDAVPCRTHSTELQVERSTERVHPSPTCLLRLFARNRSTEYLTTAGQRTRTSYTILVVPCGFKRTRLTSLAPIQIPISGAGTSP